MRAVLIWQDGYFDWEPSLASPRYVTHVFLNAPALLAYLAAAPETLRPFVVVVADSLPRRAREAFYAEFLHRHPARFAQTTILLAQRGGGVPSVELWKRAHRVAPENAELPFYH